MDVGYSGLKVVSGTEKSACVKKAMPTGVIEDCTSNGLNIGNTDSLRVTVDDKLYVTCVPPADLGESYTRTLHKDYTDTVNYKALFHSALLLSSVPEIDVLVTGLPVNQFLDPKNRKELQAQLEGNHQVTRKKEVKVKKVVVVPQPFGGYMEYINKCPEMLNRKILVFDPGFFSIDWALISKCNVDPSVLGTSVNAVSALFEKASHIISQEYGGNVSIDQIEDAVINQSSVYLFGDEIELEPILRKAANLLQENIVNQIKATLRSSKSDIDIVLMVGGGAKMFESVIRETCPKSKLVNLEHAHLSNAQGFWDIAAATK